MNINREYITKINLTDKNSTTRIKYIVIHYFGGLATAKNLALYWARTYAGASAHYAVGHDGQIYQCVEDDDIAWHCGAKSYKHAVCRNSNSIGIEMAVKKNSTKTQKATDKDWYFTPETVAATVELTKMLMKKYSIPAENVIRHYDVTGKICPNPYYYNLHESTWKAFKDAISAPDTISSENTRLTLIMGQAQVSAGQIATYLISKNPLAVSYAEELAKNYIIEGEAEGVRGDIAAAQSMIETGNFTFEGSALTLDQNNYCGMGVTQRGMKGNSFASMREGIRAQIQHLKAYATDESLNGACVDPRYQYVDKGCAPYVEWLGQRENPNGKGWAAGTEYGTKIKRVLSAMENIATTGTSVADGAQNTTQEKNESGIKGITGSIKIIYKGAVGVKYRTVPDYNAKAAGVAKCGEVFTVIGEIGDFYKLKSGWYITKRADLVQFTKIETKRYAKIIYKGKEGVKYRRRPDYNDPAAGVVKYGAVYTIVGEEGDFYKLKSGWYITKRADLVELIEAA